MALKQFFPNAQILPLGQFFASMQIDLEADLRSFLANIFYVLPQGENRISLPLNQTCKAPIRTLVQFCAFSLRDTKNLLAISHSKSKQPIEDFCSEMWSLLHSIVGDEAMKIILTKGFLFRKMKNECYIQLTGAAVFIPSQKIHHHKIKARTVEKCNLMYRKPIFAVDDFVKFSIFTGRRYPHVRVFLQDIFGNEDLRLVQLQENVFAKILHRIESLPLKALLDSHCTIEGDKIQTPHHQVYLFSRIILAKTFGKAFFGLHNLRTIQKNLLRLIKLKRSEVVSVNELIRGIRAKDFQFVFPFDKKDKNNLRRLEKMAFKLVWWLFYTLFTNLLRHSFYITEASGENRAKTCYFRHDIWLKSTKQLCIQPKNYQQISPQVFSALSNSASCPFGLKKTRIIPKDTGGFRVIYNFSKSARNEKQSPNELLSPFLPVLYLMRRQNPLLLGNAVLGFKEVFNKLITFTQKLKRSGNSGKPLYFAKIDLKECYDSIVHDKLIQILQDSFKEADAETFQIRKFCFHSAKKKKVQKVALSEAESFQSLIEEHIEHFNRFNSVFVDQSTGQEFIEAHKMLHLMETFVRNNIVTSKASGDTFWKQFIGIPQGSVLSVFLCGLYYGDFDKKAGLCNFNQNELLMRYVDDYLFVSTDATRVQYFLDLFSQGKNTEYNFIAHPNKTETNIFDSSISTVRWCGLNISLADFTVNLAPPNTAIKECPLSIHPRIQWKFNFLNKMKL